MLPKISIIMPSYNQAAYIRSAILSVLQQDYPNLELVVMDGGSTDGTVSVLQSFAKRLRWVSQKDRGQADAINRGIRLTDGDIVGYLNSDDRLAPGSLWRVGIFFSQHPETLWLTGDYGIINSQGRRISPEIWIYKYVQRSLASLFPQLWPIILGVNNPIAQPSTFWRRSAHVKVGYFNQKYQYVLDYDFWLRLLEHQPPAVIGEVLSFFRVHCQSKGGRNFQQQFAQQFRCAQEHQYPGYLLAIQNWLNRFVCWSYSRRER